MMEIDKLKTLLAINKNALDEEISQQPMLFYDIAEACVEAMAERDTAKEALATVDAKLDGLVRSALDKSKEKVTEAMVKNSIQMHKEHMVAFEAYMRAKSDADLILALKEAFGQRGYMLRDLCQLYVSGLYEQNSVRETAATDRAAYKATRERLSVARAQAAK